MEQNGLMVLEVKGGGRVQIDSITKTIHVWDKSTVYGGVVFSEVKHILQDAYPNFTIINEIPSVLY